MLTPFFPSLRAVLAPMGSRTRTAHQSLLPATLAQIEDRLSGAIPSTLFAKPGSGSLSRERVYPLFRIFWCWIWQALQPKTPCREVVRQVQALFSLHGSRRVDEGSAAYCRARARLPLALLQKIFAASFQAAEGKAAPSQLLQGRSIQLVDGTGLRLPDTASNRKAYPDSGNQFQRPRFPVMKVLALFSLSSGALRTVVTGSWYEHELRLFKRMVDALVPRQILVGDRIFGQFLVAVWLQDKRIDLIARLATHIRHVDFRRATRRLDPKDALFTWKKPLRVSALVSPRRWRKVPSEITVRIIRAKVSKAGFRTREMTLVTTLIDPVKYPRLEILEAYALRWRMELCFDDLKTTMGIEMLSCRSSQMVQKELLIFLTAYNLIRWIMVQAAKHGEVELAQLSFKGTIDTFRHSSHALARASTSRNRGKVRQRLWHQLLESLCRDPVPKRPGRREPRAVKKPRKYEPLRKARHLFVERPSRRARARRATALRKAKP